MYEKLKTKSGLNVIVSPMKHMASVSMGIWIGVGGRYEMPKENGISHLVEHMLFKGTHTRSAKDLKEAIEGVGGAFNGFTSDEVTCYMVKVPEKYTELGLEILSDMVLDPKFDSGDLAREKFVVCEEIKMYRDQPADHVLDVLSEIMWPKDALGRPLTGTMATVKSMTKKELVNFTEEYYHPSNMAIIAAGKVDPKKVLKFAEQKFEGLKKRKKLTFKKSLVKQKKACIKTFKTKIKQAHIALGFHSTEKDIRKRIALKLMNVILGGNMSSRLFEELREKYGLCYDISSSYKRHSDVGEVQVHAGVDKKNTLKSIIAITDELKKIKDLGVTSDELERAKRYAKGQFSLAMEATSTRMMWLGDRFMVHNTIPEVKKVLSQIDKATPKEILEIAGKVFQPKNANLAIVSDLGVSERTKIKRQLDKL